MTLPIVRPITGQPRLGQDSTTYADNADTLVSELPDLVDDINAMGAAIPAEIAAEKSAITAQLSAELLSAQGTIRAASSQLSKVIVLGDTDGTNKDFEVIGGTLDGLYMIFADGLKVDQDSIVRNGNSVTLPSAPSSGSAVEAFAAYGPESIAPDGYKRLSVVIAYDGTTEIVTSNLQGTIIRKAGSPDETLAANSWFYTGDGTAETIHFFVDDLTTNGFMSFNNDGVMLATADYGISFSDIRLASTNGGSLLLSAEVYASIKGLTGMSQCLMGSQDITSVPLFDTSGVTTMQEAFRQCSSLVSIPNLNTSLVKSFNSSWFGCSGLTSFPLLDTSSGTTFTYAWRDCTSLISFPLLDTSSGTTFDSAWRDCTSLISFPLLDTSSGTVFDYAWRGCGSLTSFPLLDTSSGTNLSSAWKGCASLTSFPAIDTSSCVTFSSAFYECTGLTSFPFLDLSLVTGFSHSWFGCSSLVDFPAGVFDNSAATNFYNAFAVCALSQTSVDNILVSINAANTSGGSLSLHAGTSSAPSSTGLSAKTTLEGRGWTVTVNT